MNYRWDMADLKGADWFLGSLPTPLRYIVFARGYPTSSQARDFLGAVQPDVEITGIEPVATRLCRAIRDKEGVIVYGDFDVDGITSTALLVSLLNELGADARSYIPDRFDEGYGLHADAIRYFEFLPPRLLVTVDCGIRAVKEIELAQSLGFEVIVIDHHEPGDTSHPANLIIDPKFYNDPFRDYAAVGLVYRLALAISNQFDRDRYQLDNLIDLAALGTVADVVPLVGDNRFIVNYGLNQIRAGGRAGLKRLVLEARLHLKNLRAEDLAFMVCPRLNAAGRIENAYAAYDLLMARDTKTAEPLAERLESQNAKRQRITKEMSDHAEQIAFEHDPDGLVAFASSPEYHAGVVGLVASRLVQKFYRPALVAVEEDGYLRGSCRSIPMLNIVEALTECDDLLESYGGHAMAAGFRLSADNLSQFLDRLCSVIHGQLSGQDLTPSIKVDTEWSVDDVTPELMKQLNWLEPTGHGNPAPKFVDRELKVERARLVGSGKSHLSLLLSDGDTSYKAIAFNRPDLLQIARGFVDIVYTPQWNEYRGVRSIQLVIHDLKGKR